MTYNMNVLFWLVRSKSNSAGTAPIYARVTVNGRRAEVATHLRCIPKQWDQKRQQVRGRDAQTAQVNARLQDLRRQIYDIFYELQRKGLPCTAATVKRAYNAPALAQLTLLEALDAYVAYQRDVKRVRKGTLTTYRGRRMNLEAYLYASRQGNLSLCEVTLRHANEFYSYLISERKAANSHARNLVGFVRSILDYSVRQEWLTANPLTAFKAEKNPPPTIVSLTGEELRTLRELESSGTLTGKQHVSLVCFLAQCYTSLAYADLMNLCEDYITLDLQQRPWIVMKRQKTGKALKLPLLRQAEQLLQPLNYRLPRISCASYNYHLQSLASKAGITKHISSHVGRKTYGNIARAAGVSLEMIGEVYSHSDTRTTKAHYVDTLPEGLYEQMENIRF